MRCRGCVAAAAGQRRQGLRRAAGLQVAILVRKADDRFGVADVHPLRIGSAGIEVNTERRFQVSGEDLHLAGLAVRADTAKDEDLSRVALRQEDVAIGRHPHQARVIEPGRKLLHLEAGGCLGPNAVRAGNDCGSIVGRWRGIRLGKVGDGELTFDAGLLLAVVGKGRLAGQRLCPSRKGGLGSAIAASSPSCGYVEGTKLDRETEQFHGEVLQGSFSVERNGFRRRSWWV